MGRLLLLPLLLLLWSVERSDGSIAAYGKPPSCDKFECPSYQVVHYQDGLEIRSYKKAIWMSTPLVNSSSFMTAVDSGFMSLFNYIQGNNKQNARIEMTAPVLIDVHPSEGPFCNSSFVARFFVPQKNQNNPPLSDQVHPETWPKQSYAAVRRFGGFMDDSNIAVEAAALRKSLEGTQWNSAVEKNMMKNPSVYTVAGYNSPFEIENRANEVMLLFDM
ncbi:uncharacterized protein [Typha angustifolia]|uniref:uncharacterized protein n=1 Tax=Typha angustifolia TaxID=59011 RepID=UPI003C2DBAAC